MLVINIVHFVTGIIVSAVPIVGLNVIFAVGSDYDFDTLFPWIFAWLAALFLLPMYIGLAGYYGDRGKQKLRAGLIAGVGIGAISLGVTCFSCLIG